MMPELMMLNVEESRETETHYTICDFYDVAMPTQELADTRKVDGNERVDDDDSDLYSSSDSCFHEDCIYTNKTTCGQHELMSVVSASQPTIKTNQQSSSSSAEAVIGTVRHAPETVDIQSSDEEHHCHNGKQYHVTARPAIVKLNQHAAQSDWKIPKNRRWLLNQIWLAVAVSCGSLIVGFTSAYTSPALESMKQSDSPLALTESQATWVGSLMPLSAILGAVVSGWLLDRFGRRVTVAATAVPFLISFTLIGLATSVYIVYTARAIAGLAIGVLSLAMPVFLGETVHPKIRGTLGMFPTTIGNSGIMLCFLMGSYLRWDYLALSAIIFPLMFACMMWFMPESPHWYLSKGRVNDARRVIQWLRGNRQGEASDTSEDAEIELQNVISHLRQDCRTKCCWRSLLQSKMFRRPLLISLTLMIFQQMSGINAVIFYASSIFEKTNESISSNLSSVIIGAVNVVSSLLANFIIDKIGRKVLLYTSSALVAFTLFSLSVYFYLLQNKNVDRSVIDSISWLPLVSLILFVLAFTLGWGPIPWLFLGEGLPSHMRERIGSLASTFNWACTFLITKTFSDLNRIAGVHGTFLIFGCFMVASIVVVYMFLPETRGRTLIDIERSMRRKCINTNRILVSDSV